jgi:hypothetical protein
MMPLYEAVVNSIHASEEDAENCDISLEDHQITIRVLRTENLFSKNSKSEKGPIEGFEIRDDGAGFNEDNWQSFNTLDSLHKEKKGCRGVGRLMWLKAFRTVDVDSVFTTKNGNFRRRFSFDPVDGVTQSGPADSTSSPKETRVTLSGIQSKYADNASKTLQSIAEGLLEHCLWYFIRDEGVPAINMQDGSEVISLLELFDTHMHSSAKHEVIKIGENTFEITHVKFRASMHKLNTLNYCAAGRLVKEESLQGKIPGLFGIMSDAAGDFTYAAYLTSPYLDEHVYEQRTGFYIDEENSGIFADISLKEIRERVIDSIKKYLRESLSEKIKESETRLQKYVNEIAPRYRPILPHIDENTVIDPSISDRDLDLALHRQLYKVEERMISEGHEIMTPFKGETQDAYRERLKKYLETVADLKQSDLANYVMHRRVIIDLFESAMSNKSGEFAPEDIIHDLIVPMQKTSDDMEYRRQNLWLLDERLAFHHYLASDKTISSNKTTSDTSTKEPDISALRLFDTPFLAGEKNTPSASITVIEIKRPMRKGFKGGEGESKDPILQGLDYLQRLRSGASTRDGRPIPDADRIPGYVYVLADLTDSMKKCCRLHQLMKTADGMGYFGYHRDETYNAYIEVMSYDRLIAAAKERNRAFFDQLQLPSK